MGRGFIKLGPANQIPLKINLFLWILACCMLSMRADAQPSYFRHYQVENGLSHNTVYCSIQDKKGFLWFGTKDGLNRFDGYTFKVFRHTAQNRNSPGNNRILALYEQDNQHIWVGTDKGLYTFNPETETFKTIPSFEHTRVNSLCPDAAQNLWMLADGQLCRYHLPTGKVETYRNIQHFIASSLCLSPRGTIWLAAADGKVERFIPEESRFTGTDVFSHSPASASRELECIYTDTEDRLFIGTPFQGFKLFSTKNRTYKDLLTWNADHTPVYVRGFIKTGAHEYWIATESGIFIYDALSGRFTHVKKKNTDPYSLSDNAVYCLFKDKQDGIWAGTYFGGLNYYPRQYALFSRYYAGDAGNRLKGNIVREIKKDHKGHLWIGTEDNGLNCLDRQSGLWTHYVPGRASGLSSKNIQGLLPLGNELLIGTFRHGLDLMNTSTGKVDHHFLPDGKPGSLNSNFILNMYRTASGSILLASDRGLYRYVPGSRTFLLLPLVPREDFIHTVLEDHSGQIWLGTWNDGIYITDPQLKKTRELTRLSPLLSPLKNTLITSLFEDSNFNIWICTDGMGLWKYSPADGTVKIYDTNTGLPGNYVYRTLQDARLQVWISTSRGLACLNPANGQIKTYTVSNGLLSDQFNYSSAFKDSDGTMYFGCIKGLISFNPAAFMDKDTIGPVYITSFQVQNKELRVGPGATLHRSVKSLPKIQLDTDAGSVSIDFAALNYAAPEMTRYSYKVEGLDKNWTLLKTNRRVNITGLAPGNYLFRVKASANGQWGQGETDLPIFILPPWWQCTGAWVGYASLGLLSLSLLVRSLNRKKEQRSRLRQEAYANKKEKDLYHAHIEYFTRITHEFRTPLTLIRGPMEKVLMKAAEFPDLQKNLLIMERNTNRLLDLANQLLEYKKNETGRPMLRAVRTDLRSVLEEVFMNFNSLAELKGISYTMQLPQEELTGCLDAEIFRQVLSNIFFNALKYSHKKVSIKGRLSLQGDWFLLEISNDGYLIPDLFKEKIFKPYFRMAETQDQPGTGMGLALARSLAGLLHGTLTLEKQQKGLNTFCLNLPVQLVYTRSDLARTDTH